MAVATFIQVSDLHLGRPFGWLPADKRAERRTDQRRALELVVREAIERGAQAILLPGDLFDVEGVDADTLAFATHAFAVAGCPPVYVAPGNHDPWSESSPLWSQRHLRARGWSWPEHVRVFSTAHWSPMELPGAEGVRIWGRCSAAGVATSQRPLAEGSIILPASADATGLDIAVFHGSLEEHCPAGQKIVSPFSENEVKNSPFGYHAVGHYHTRVELKHKAAQETSTSSRGNSGVASAGVRLAYAGSAVALAAHETGAHGALEVRVEYGRRQPFIEIEPIELDRRHVYEVKADVSGASSAEQVDRRIGRALADAGVSDRDIVTVRARGRLVKGVRYGAPGESLRARCFHVNLDLREVRPDYDLDAYRRDEAATTEQRFAKALLTKLDAEQSPAERALLESALYYGLDAFRLREVVPGYEEIGE